jgi:hypothetical protein
MLPIAFIPMDAITHMLFLLEFVMKKSSDLNIPDTCHPLSLERHFKENKVLAECVRWDQLAKKQQQQLINADLEKREKEREEKVSSVLDQKIYLVSKN